MNATYAGHSAVYLEADGFVVAIDPWLMGNPACPQHMETPPKVDVIVLTHGHGDHAGDVVRVQKLTNAPIVATFELALILGDEGVPEDKLIFANKGGSVSVGPARVSLTHAYHSSSFESPTRGVLYAGEACGTVLQLGGRRVFHAGDTALFGDLELIRQTYQPEVAFLPIGDVYTMGPLEAAEAARMLGVRQAVPIHFKTFESLVQDASPFLEACRHHGIEAFEMLPGETRRL